LDVRRTFFDLDAATGSPIARKPLDPIGQPYRVDAAIRVLVRIADHAAAFRRAIAVALDAR
jgi:hypothetical protein